MKAFTLVELIITIAIFSMLSLISAPIGLNYLQSSDAETTVRQIISDISEQQQNSYTKKGKTFNNPTEICFGIQLANLSTQNSYDFYDGTWDSANTKCTPVNIKTKKLSNRSGITPSVNEIVFTPGSFKPVSLGTTNADGTSTTITGVNSHFTNTLKYNDSIALSSAPTVCASITTNPVNSDTLIVTNTALGNGSDNQNIIKCININVKNNSYNYVMYLTDEGLLYYKRI